MKILVVCQYYYPEPFRISDICESLVKKGHDVTVLTGLPNYPEGVVLKEYRYGERRNEIINGVKIKRAFEIGRGNNKLKLFLNYLSFAVSGSLNTLLMKEKFDVVLINQLSPVMMGIPALVYKKRHKTKVLLYCLDLWPASLAAGGIKENSLIYKIFLSISKWIYKNADTVAVSSSSFKDYFKDSLGIDSLNIEYLPQYSEEIFNENKGIILNNIFNFVFAGNIGDMQSVETIVKAANELRTHTDIKFHIIGEGSKLVECKSLTNNLGLDNIIFYGRKALSEMPKFYGMADAMLVTLKANKIISYTLPGKVQSYMAAAKPIIGAINGETNRVIQEAECGLCCAAENYRHLAKLILEFCNSGEKEEMARNSYNYYINNFSQEKFILKLEKNLSKLGGSLDV